MARLAGPAVIPFRSGGGAVLSLRLRLGVAALLPAVLAPPGCVPPSQAAKRPWTPRLAQDVVAPGRGFGRVAFGLGSLRLAPAQPLAYATGTPGTTPAVPARSAVPAHPAGRGPAPGPGPCGDAGWFSPAPEAAISQVFGVPDPEYAAGYHTGVDFAVSSGTPLLAIADSVVEEAGWGGAYGNLIVLRLPDHDLALYAHLSRLDVRIGDHVRAGGRLGLSGETGHARGPHLHFEIRTEDRYGAVIDPLPYLRAHRCRV